MNPITVQEQHVPGSTLEEKFQCAQSWGFDGLELRGKGDGGFAARRSDLVRARRNGVLMPTVCVEMSHFIGAFDADLREDALVQLTQQLEVMSDIGGRGVMTPASYGMFSMRLPPFAPPRSEAEDRRVLLDALHRLGLRAEELGVELYLEPLNRYEDHMVNRLSDAASLIRECDSPAVKIVADTYHMNIEEADPAKALLDNADLIGHVQASDSNRLEPGAGHIDWALFGATIQSLRYDGTVAIESRLSGDAEEVLPRAASLLRRYL